MSNRKTKQFRYSRLEGLRINFAPNVRDDLLSHSISRAKATRSVSLLKLKARCAFNASSVASALTARAFFRAADEKKSLADYRRITCEGLVSYARAYSLECLRRREATPAAPRPAKITANPANKPVTAPVLAIL